VPVIDEIIRTSVKKGQKPFLKAIIEFKNIMASSNMSPLEKLFRLQNLSIMEGYNACR
jgi:hypothetical protein